MYKFFYLLFFLAFSTNLYCQDSLQNGKKINIGIEAGVISGFGYCYSLGSSVLLNKRHAIALGISALVPENPFKDKWNYGAYLDYNFFFKKMKNKRLMPYISLSFQYLNTIDLNEYSSQPGATNPYHVKYEEKDNSFFSILGFGMNIKLIKNLYLKPSVGIYTAGFFGSTFKNENFITGQTSNKTSKSFEYNSFSDFSMDELSFKCTLTYYFK